MRKLYRKYIENYYSNEDYRELRNEVNSQGINSLTVEKRIKYRQFDEEYERLVNEKFQVLLVTSFLRGVDIDLNDIEAEDIDSLSLNENQKVILKSLKEEKADYAKENIRQGEFDGIHASKLAGWMVLFPQIKGEIAQFLDSHQEIEWEENINVLRVLTEFNRNPRLGIVLPRIQVISERLTAAGRAFAAAEPVWNAIVMRFKQRMDALGFYGKGFMRIEFLKEYEGFPDDLVSEDIVQAFMLMLYGMETKHIEYLDTWWRAPLSLLSMIAPLGKWSAGSAEFLMERAFKRFMFSKIIPWNKKIGTIVTGWFYWKKPWVVFSIITFIIVGYILNGLFMIGNPFMGMPNIITWTLMGMLFAEAINLPRSYIIGRERVLYSLPYSKQSSR